MPVLPSNKRRIERRGQTQRGGGLRNHRQPSELRERFLSPPALKDFPRGSAILYIASTQGAEPAAPCNGAAEPKHAISRGVNRH